MIFAFGVAVGIVLGWASLIAYASWREYAKAKRSGSAEADVGDAKP